MGGEEMYHWFEQTLKQQWPDAASQLVLTFEPSVTPGIFFGKITAANLPDKALVKTDVRPEGVRLHFPVSWGDELSDWLGAPPAEAYRLKSNWVHQPSIGVAAPDFDPYFKDLVAKVIQMLRRNIIK
jgi:hypothetical protein